MNAASGPLSGLKVVERGQLIAGPSAAKTLADIAADPHYAACGMLGQVTLDDVTKVAVPGFVPKLSLTPGNHRRNAPALGQDTEAVLREVGVTAAQMEALRQRGVIG